MNNTINKRTTQLTKEQHD